MRLSEPERRDFRVGFVWLDGRGLRRWPFLSVLENDDPECRKHQQQEDDYQFAREGRLVIHGYTYMTSLPGTNSETFLPPGLA